MNKTIAFVLAATIFATPALADDNSSGCKGNCSATPGSSSESNAVGVGLGIGISGSSSSASTGPVTNTNLNASTALGGNATGGSVKIGDTSLRNSFDSDITSVNANSNTSKNNNNVTGVNLSTNSNTGTNTSSNVNNLSSGDSRANSNQNQGQSTENANNSSVTVQGDQAQKRNPVSTAYAAPLTAGFDTCMGSSTAGAQGIGFGISLGSTWTDKNCVRLKNARELQTMGQPAAAVQLMCIDKDVRKAMAAAGTPCESVIARK